MNVTTCSRANLQERDVENPAARRTEDYSRLVAITNTHTLSVTRFVYPVQSSTGLCDGNGARVMTINPDSSSTVFPAQNAGLCVGEHYEVEGSTTRSYYYLGGQRIAMRVDDGQSSDVFWFHSDHLGSTSTLPLRFGRDATPSDINGNEVVTSTVRFYPYGEYRVTPSAGLTDKGFTGHAQNDEVALIYMRARYYVPGVGRFLQSDEIVPDPKSPQSMNRYTYANNNPVIFFDCSGHCSSDDYSDTGTRGMMCNTFLEYGILFDGAYWETEQLSSLFTSMFRLIGFLGPERFHTIVQSTPSGNLTLVKLGGDMPSMNVPGATALARAFENEILFSTTAFASEQSFEWIFTHEFAHIWDQDAAISTEFERLTGGLMRRRFGTDHWYYDAGPPGSPTAYGETNQLEDFAETFLTIMYPQRLEAGREVSFERRLFFDLAVDHGPISPPELASWFENIRFGTE